MVSRRTEKMLARAGLAEAQGHVCFLCGTTMIPAGESLDHVFPGDRRLYQNALMAHRWCNSQKNDRLPFPCELVWLATIEQVLRGSDVLATALGALGTARETAAAPPTSYLEP